jgi:hypothetical protein
MFITPAKLVNEDVKITFDFANEMIAGSTISTFTCTATAYSGVDASPSSIVSTTFISGQTVTVIIDDGVEGCIYLLTFTITTSDSQVRIAQTFLAIEPAAGF